MDQNNTFQNNLLFGHGIFYIRIDYIWNRFCKMPQFSMTLHNFLQKVGSLFYSWHMSWTKSLYVCLQVDPKRLQGFIFLISILIFVYFLKYKTIVLYVLQFSLLIFFCLGSVCWVLNSKKKPVCYCHNLQWIYIFSNPKRLFINFGYFYQSNQQLDVFLTYLLKY